MTGWFKYIRQFFQFWRWTYAAGGRNIMDIKKIIIPGPAQAILIGVLELPQESTLHEMVVEIERLKTVGRGYVPAEKGIVPAKAKRRSRKQEHVNSEQQESDEDAEA